jgi:spore maturation protein A
MINHVWFFLIVFGIIFSLITGNLNEVNESILKEAQEGVLFSISLMGCMAFWMGIMNIAKKSGLINKMAKGLRPIMRFLFPEIPDGHPALNSIVMNMILNMFGVGNAATAFGLKAMEDMNTLNKNKKRATNAMCMFLVVNMSSLQLIPLTVIKIRMDLGSKAPYEIIAPTLMSTFISTVIAIGVCKALERRKQYD